MQEQQQERAPSRFLEPEAHTAYMRKAGHTPTTRLNTALTAREAAVKQLDPLIAARAKVVARIDTVLSEYRNPSTLHDRELELEQELTSKYGLYSKRWYLSEDIKTAQQHLDDVERRVRSAQRELDEAIAAYVHVRTGGYDDSLVQKTKFENRIEKVRADAKANAQEGFDEAERVLSEKKDVWGNALSDNFIIKRSDAIKRESKKILDAVAAEVDEIEQEAARYRENRERHLKETLDTLIRVGGTDAVSTADKRVNRWSASD